ncbi:hypothetical protein U3516DRAFT_770087 [Neocallimastix sp. 'constans']
MIWTVFPGPKKVDGKGIYEDSKLKYSKTVEREIDVLYCFKLDILKNIRNKNKTSWNNLCGCQINTYTISGIQLFEKQQNTRVHIALYGHATKRN